MNSYKILLTAIVMLWCSVVQPLSAQVNESDRIQIGVFGSPGISGAYGNYPSQFKSSPDFSFSAGVRARFHEAFGSKMMMAADVGFLEVAYTADVEATDTYFYSSYNFLTLNVLAGTTFGSSYYAAGGFFYAKSLEGSQYRESLDQWVTLDQNDDFGFLAEIGKDLGSYLTVGIQGRYGLVSIGESVDIKTWAFHGRIGLNILSFD